MSNRTRPKTREQQLKEYQELKDVEEERARKRQLAAQNNHAAGEVKAVPENFPELVKEKGEARDLAAARVGLSGKTAEKGAEILEAVDGERTKS